MKLSDCAPARHLFTAALVAVAVTVTACGGKSPVPAKSTAADSVARQAADSAAAMAAVRDTATARRLSPAADSAAPYLVFIPREERVLVAAVRNKQLLLDVGRMDLDVRKDSARLRAFNEAAPVLSPVPPGSAFRLHWAQGEADVVADSFAVYNGRIVMRLFGSPALDSAVRGKGTLVALAIRADTPLGPMATACELRAPVVADTTPEGRAALKAQARERAVADSAYDARVKAVRDSIETELRLEHPPYERLQRRTKSASSQVRGCFGAARRALVVSLRAGDAEWVRERMVLVAPNGAVTPLRVSDLRFRAHDLLVAFDADGDGVDDLATRATTERAGGTTVLRVDLGNKRAERLAGGFAWEVF